MPISEWREQNAKWNVRLMITDATSPEVFYFCHIHGGMSGKINVCDIDVQAGKCVPRPVEGINKKGGYIVDTPVNLYSHSVPLRYDQRCGSTGLAGYSPGRNYDRHCKGKVFMCSIEQKYDHFANCFDAVNCAMHAKMKVEYTGNCQELFINQMIPHHQNAVNMAKTTLLYLGSSLTIPCDDDPSKQCPDVEATDLLREIIQKQNTQIQYMREYLSTISGALAKPVMCTDPTRKATATTSTKPPFDAFSGAALWILLLLLALLALSVVPLYVVYNRRRQVLEV